jgi:hypothetical protein
MKLSKYIIVLLMAGLLFACKQKGNQVAEEEAPDLPDTTEVKAIPPDQLITPGQAIGHIRLEAGLDSIVRELGRPDTGDAAMGSELATWYANHDTAGYKTSIFARHNMGNADEPVKHIKKILVTSPWFKTAEYISTGNNLKDIRKFYTLKKGSTYTAKGQTIQVYTDMTKGISFEIDPAGNCVSILVHAPNSAADTYINMH